VGYDGHEFLVHDPQNTDGQSIGYSRRTWENQMQLSQMERGDNIVTCVIPTEQLDPCRPRVTINYVNNALKSETDQKRYQTFRWCPAVRAGYGFCDAAGVTQTEMPADTVVLRGGAGIEVVNNSLTERASVGVWLNIRSLGPERRHYQDYRTLLLEPNSLATYKAPEIRVDLFREKGNAPVEYTALATVTLGGKDVDRQTIRFVMGPAESATAWTLQVGKLPWPMEAGAVMPLDGEPLGLEIGNVDVDVDKTGRAKMSYGSAVQGMSLTGSGTVLPNPAAPKQDRLTHVWKLTFKWSCSAGEHFQGTVEGTVDGGLLLSGTGTYTGTKGDVNVPFDNITVRAEQVERK
jgi:hypothetical protein